MMRCCFITLGCRVNQYESDAMAELLTQAGFEITENPAEADVCIVNTCTVTNIADRKSRQMLSKAHKLNPNAKLIAAGCFAQRSPEAAAKLEGVYAVLGSADKNRVVELVKSIAEGRENESKSEKCNCGEKELCDCCGGMKKFEQPENSECSGNAAGGTKILVRDVMHEHEFEEMSAVHEGRTRAYLKIQDGCNMFCTYCAIPYARGGLRSRSIESVRAEAEKLNNEGFSEVVLTGIHLMSYGRDLRSGTDIRDAVRCFDGLNNIKRIRFGSLEPHMMTDEIIAELADNKRICRQFHLSLQSGSDTVLERMRRGYTSGQYFELCQKLRRAFGGETAVTTDIIAGFPGETEEEHLETIEFMRKVGFAKVHIFPYSRRSGTKADAMPGQLSNAEKSRRAGELIAVGRESEHEYLEQYVGETVNVLIEKCIDNVSYGCTDTYAAVRINSAITPNTFADVKIKYIKEDMNGELYLL